MAATVEELKEMIVDLRMTNIAANIPMGNCPYAYYRVPGMHEVNCIETNCRQCRSDFMDAMRIRVAAEVAEL